MTNSHYVGVALGYVPENFVFGQIRVEYRKSAICGDTMIPKIAVDENKITIVLADEADKPYAIVEFVREQ